MRGGGPSFFETRPFEFSPPAEHPVEPRLIILDGQQRLDPWDGFAGFLERVFSLHAANRGLKDVLAARGQGSGRAEAMRAQIKPLLRTAIERAQQQGTLRSDFTAEDLPVLFWSGERVIHATATDAPDYWRRYLALLLDGLRAEAATTLPGRPLTLAQLGRASQRRNA